MSINRNLHVLLNVSCIKMSSYSDENFDLVEEAYEYKINGNYPEGCKANQKRSIRTKASKMILCIFLARKQKGKVLVSILFYI